jgi:hypothetical protein
MGENLCCRCGHSELVMKLAAIGDANSTISTTVMDPAVSRTAAS